MAAGRRIELLRGDAAGLPCSVPGCRERAAFWCLSGTGGARAGVTLHRAECPAHAARFARRFGVTLVTAGTAQAGAEPPEATVRRMRDGGPGGGCP